VGKNRTVKPEGYSRRICTQTGGEILADRQAVLSSSDGQDLQPNRLPRVGDGEARGPQAGGCANSPTS